ncbi:serum amyloid A-5 protein-like [Hyperolius riggenbachi]|uniref:serum amyloid A-5 protein-like n=1 Tax=Hyperolius riggenbachi TaxID=752182 RepID=UPI0035A396D4
MRASLILLLLGLAGLAVVQAQFGWARKSGRFIKQAAQGSRDMYRAYDDMKKSNWRESDKYFHARGNYDAARRGSGGVFAAKVISNVREGVQRAMGESAADSRADQAANRWGRNGGDPNRYRPKGLPSKY